MRKLAVENLLGKEIVYTFAAQNKTATILIFTQCRLVAFKDMSNEHVFITRSCVNTKETIDIEGVTYPLVKVEISNTSHPFYTGKMKLVDTAGRVDKFYQRYKNRQK